MKAWIGKRGLRMYKQVVMLACVLSVCSFFACAKTETIAEIEPNDAIYSAMELALPIRVNAEIAGKTDVDYFKVVMDASSLVTVTATAQKPGFDLELTYVSEAGDALKRANDFNADEEFRAGGEKLFRLFLNAGEHYFRVRDARGDNLTIPYTITFEPAPVTRENEEEPNDAFDYAREIAPGVTIEGYYFPEKNILNAPNANMRLAPDLVEYDCFFIPPLLGSAAPAALTIDLSATPAIDGAIRVYDEYGAFLFEHDTKGEGGSETIDYLAYPNGRGYYLAVYAKNRKANARFPYSLRTFLSAQEPDREYEPNNDPVTAMYIDEYMTYRGKIHYLGDEDCYRFVAKRMGLIMRLRALDAILLKGTLKDAYGAVLKSFSTEEAGYNGNIEFPSLIPGSEYVITLEGYRIVNGLPTPAVSKDAYQFGLTGPAHLDGGEEIFYETERE